jgi:hypothetical protein
MVRAHWESGNESEISERALAVRLKVPASKPTNGRAMTRPMRNGSTSSLAIPQIS